MPAGSSEWEWSSDVAAADWIRDALRGFAVDVGSVIPRGFEAYVRIFHPARRRDGEQEVKVRWGEIASWSGRVVHPEMQFHSIATPVGDVTNDRPWDGEHPPDGALDLGEAQVLVDPLARHTSTPGECWFCLWDGYGHLHGGAATASMTRRGVAAPLPGLVPPEVRAGPRVHLPGRDYFLYRGEIDAVMAFCVEPFPRTSNLWWPEDRAWCVASEIDFYWTYVGGTSDLIEQLLGDDRFEALPARLTDGIAFNSDHVNI